MHNRSSDIYVRDKRREQSPTILVEFHVEVVFERVRGVCNYLENVVFGEKRVRFNQFVNSHASAEQAQNVGYAKSSSLNYRAFLRVSQGRRLFPCKCASVMIGLVGYEYLKAVAD